MTELSLLLISIERNKASNKAESFFGKEVRIQLSWRFVSDRGLLAAIFLRERQRMCFSKSALDKYSVNLVSAPEKLGFNQAVVIQVNAYSFDECAHRAIAFAAESKTKVVLHFNGVYLPIKPGITVAEAWQEFQAKEYAGGLRAARKRRLEGLCRKQQKDALNKSGQNLEARRGEALIEALKKQANGGDYLFYAIRRLSNSSEISDFASHFQKIHPKQAIENITFAVKNEFVAAGSENFWMQAIERLRSGKSIKNRGKP